MTKQRLCTQMRGKMLLDCIANACKFTSKIHVQIQLLMDEKDKELRKPGIENGGV